MFNTWDRTYVQTFNQRTIFDSKTILASKQWSKVMFAEGAFKDDGELMHQEWDIDDVVTKHYDGSYSKFMASVLAENVKWAIVVEPLDYYKLLAYYLKEVQATFKLTDKDLHTLAFSYAYNNFYYSGDQTFVDGFVTEEFLNMMRTVFDTYEPVGVLNEVSPSRLPTELAYFLAERKLIAEVAIRPKLVNAAKMVISRLWQVHKNDFSEWLVLDTQYFLNLLKKPTTPEVVTSDFSFAEMFAMISNDEYLNSMFFSSFPFFSSTSTWETDPNFKVTASRLISAWEGLADYLMQRGIDESWSELRHSQYAEIILRYEYVKGTCAAVRYILELDNAPDEIDKPILDMLGYDILSECFDNKYNKTLLLLTFRGMSQTFEGFIERAFAVKENNNG